MNLVINSQFRPFTFDEMLKPLVQYKEAYDATEKEYANLADLTEEWRDAAMKESNPIAYDKFNRYSNDLEATVNDFSRGMNINNRRALLGLKRRYHEEIEPIAKASKKIDELAAEQRKMSASNPNLMFSRDFSSDVSIDQMMENPNLSYKAVDGNDLYKKGVAISQAMSSRIRTLSPDMKNQYWKIVEGYGEEVANKFLLDSGAIPELNKALEDLVSSSGATDNIKDRAFEFAKQGAIAGMISKTTYQRNVGYESPAAALERAIKSGSKPYRTDEYGNKYYYDAYRGETWTMTPEGKRENVQSTRTTSTNPTISDTEFDKLPPAPHSELQNDSNIRYNDKTKKYYMRKNGAIYEMTKTEIDNLAKERKNKADNNIIEYNKRTGSSPQSPVPVFIGTIDSSDETAESIYTGVSNDKDKKEKTDKFMKKWNDDEDSPAIYRYNELPDVLKKSLDKSIKAAGLSPEDIIVSIKGDRVIVNTRAISVANPQGITQSGESLENVIPKIKIR